MTRGKYLLAVLSCLCLVGCAPVIFLAGGAAGVGAYKWYQGALIVTYEAPYMETWDASLRALNGMNLKIKTTRHDSTKGRIEAMQSDENIITVSLDYKTAKETEVTIRVGVFGDENTSIAIKDKISEELSGG